MENDLLDPDADVAMTRRQALTARGYSPEIINGHTPSPTASAGSNSTEPTRTCAGCAKELTGRQERWCSTACKKRSEYALHGRSRQQPATVPQQARPSAGTVNGGPPAVLPGIDGYRRCAYLLEDGGLLPILTRSR